MTFSARWLLGLHLGLMACLTIVQPISAQVVINELAPQPTTDSEWVELLNLGDQPVSLQGWSLSDQLQTPSQLILFTSTDLLQPLQLKVIPLTNKLNNTGDGLNLADAAGQSQDSFSYTHSTPDLSWQRVPGSSVWTEGLPTPGEVNSPPASPSPQPSPSPTPSPSVTPNPSPTPTVPNWANALQATELVACADSQQVEWLELYNPSAEPVVISQWQVQDAQGLTRPVSANLPAFGFGVIEWPSGLLNNSGDTLHLLTTNSTPLISLASPDCTVGHSWALIHNTWQTATQVTKGSRNPDQPPATAAPTVQSSPTVTPTSTPTSPTTTAIPKLSSRNQQTYQLNLPATSHQIPTQKLSTTSQEVPFAASPTPVWPALSAIMGGAVWITAAGYDLNFNPLFTWLARLV